MSDIQVLKSLGIEPWLVRDINLFKHYEHHKTNVSFNILQGDINLADSILVLLPEQQAFTKSLNNFCKFLLIGYNSNIVVLQVSSKGKNLDAIVESNNPSYIVSFVEFQKDTSNLNNNVLILNNINFNKLETSISYKKQVLLNVLRMPISSLRD